MPPKKCNGCNARNCPICTSKSQTKKVVSQRSMETSDAKLKAEIDPVNDAPRVALPKRPKRIEDVFQDDVIPRFQTMSEFKKFARSDKGLCLRNADVEGILEDYRSSEEQKYEMLALWQQRTGNVATVQRIIQITENYFTDNN